MENNNSSIIESSLFEKKKACEKLIKESVATKQFYFLLIASSFLASIGLIINNVAVVIGAMLLAPLLSPLLAIGLGLVLSNTNLIIKKTFTAIKAFVVVILTSSLTAFILSFQEINLENLLRDNFVEFFFISFIAGLVGTYIWVRTDLQNIISGVLIAVTILPPLSSLGIGLILFNKIIVNNSLIFFIINAMGLLVGGIIMFSLFGFGRDSGLIEKIVEEKMEEHEKKPEK